MGEGWRRRVVVVVFDDRDCVGVHCVGCGDDVSASWISSEMAGVGGLKVEEGHCVSLKRRRAVCRVGNTIAIVLDGRCGHHGWGG
jgi:hypothetical protein